jgi:flagellar hook assembly protein FlgD
MSAINGNSLFATDNTTTPSVSQTSAAAASAAATSDASLTSEDTFLKLLVAQIKNQDPTSPTDPTQFVAQLTQYSELEQLIQINGNGKTANANSTTTPPVTGTSNNEPSVPTGSVTQH